MKAILVDKSDRRLHWSEVPDPIMKSDEVLVKVEAAIPEAFATAYLNLFIEGNIKEGDTLLMNAGASGLASVIIPMAKSFLPFN